MLRHCGLIAVCACIAASVGCDGGGGITAPTSTVTVEFGGRVVNADAGGPVANVRVSSGVATRFLGKKKMSIAGVFWWPHRRVTPLSSRLWPTTAASPWP